METTIEESLDEHEAESEFRGAERMPGRVVYSAGEGLRNQDLFRLLDVRVITELSTNGKLLKQLAVIKYDWQ